MILGQSPIARIMGGNWLGVKETPTEAWGNERSYIREENAFGSLDILHELMVQTVN